jgi:heme exporter protein A
VTEAHAGGAAGPCLQARGLACTRGERSLFEALSFELEPGQCLHVAGANGAGKTSLLRILAGLLPPTEGAVHWRGRAIAGAREEYGAELAFVGHLNGVKDDLSAAENVRLAAALRGAAASAAEVRAALRAVQLEDYAEAHARQLSQGQKRRLALTRLCGARPPPLWILDEPFNALDVASVGVLRGLIDAQLACGGLVVLTAHQQVELPAAARRLELRAEPAPC